MALLLLIIKLAWVSLSTTAPGHVDLFPKPSWMWLDLRRSLSLAEAAIWFSPAQQTHHLPRLLFSKRRIPVKTPVLMSVQIYDRNSFFKMSRISNYWLPRQLLLHSARGLPWQPQLGISRFFCMEKSQTKPPRVGVHTHQLWHGGYRKHGSYFVIFTFKHPCLLSFGDFCTWAAGSDEKQLSMPPRTSLLSKLNAKLHKRLSSRSWATPVSQE